MYWCLWKVQFWASYFFATPMILFNTSKSTFHDPSGYASTCLLPEKEYISFRVYKFMLLYIRSIMFFCLHLQHDTPSAWMGIHRNSIFFVVSDTFVSFQSGITLKFLLALGCTTSAAGV